MTTMGIFWICFFSFIAFWLLLVLLEEVNQHIYQRFRANFYAKHHELFPKTNQDACVEDMSTSVIKTAKNIIGKGEKK